MVIELNKDNFEAETQDGLVLVDFYTTWCGPCKRMAPVLEELERVKVCKIDVEKNNDLAAEHQADAVPTFILFNEGLAVERVVGVQSRQALQSMIDKHLD